jgi:hypothetical protein
VIGPYFYALVTLYALVGAACALAARARASTGDLILLAVLWPLYGPFLLAAAPAAAGGREEDLDRALRQVAGTPLARLLPDRATVRALGRALRAAAERVREIDEVLARPGMGEVRPLQLMRERLTRRLAEVDALLAQLSAQAEVLRLGGGDALGEDLIAPLVGQVEALAEMLEDGRGALAAP